MKNFLGRMEQAPGVADFDRTETVTRGGQQDARAPGVSPAPRVGQPEAGPLVCLSKSITERRSFE